jgi:hypothetical protein
VLFDEELELAPALLFPEFPRGYSWALGGQACSTRYQVSQNG